MSRFFCLTIVALSVAGMALTASAQSAPAPATAPATAPAPNKADLDAARRLVPSAAEIDQVARELGPQPVVRLPQSSLDRNRQAAPDLRGLAEQYERIRRGPDGAASARDASGLLVFVSLGMPRASLQRLIDEAKRVRAVLVLRGVKDRSLTRTAAAVSELMGSQGPGWQIDPALFRRFDIASVPSFVLIDPARPVAVGCGDGQCQQAAFAKLQGDVSIAHALGVIADGDPELAETARGLAARLSASQRGAAR